MHWDSNSEGTHSIEVGAEGYQSQTFDAEVVASESDGCCACSLHDVDVVVVLEPEV